MENDQDQGALAPMPVPRRRKQVAVLPTTPAEMLALAVSKGASVEQLDRLISVMERARAIDAKQAFVDAMVEFRQQQLRVMTNQTGKVAPRDGTKQGYTYRYADLAAINDVVTAGLSQVGISHNWITKQEANMVSVTCVLTHKLGHSESTTLSAMPDQSGGKNSIQAIGSTVSYLRRYTLLAITGIAVEGDDDDGQAGGYQMTDEDRQSIRGGSTRSQRPGDVAASKQGNGRQQAPDDKLLADARAAADKGHGSFGPFWRGLTDQQRKALGNQLADLQDRANHADNPNQQGSR